MENKEHIVSSFDRDLEGIQAMIMKMGGLVETAIAEATAALENRDEDLAFKVRKGDKAIDELEERVNEEAARILAQRQPAAGDLRTVLTVFRLSASLERIGDYAKNIAKRVPLVAESSRQIEPVALLPSMAKIASDLVSDSFKAYADGDIDLAVSVWARDQTLDNFYTSFFRSIITYMIENPAHISESAHLLFIAKNLERIGDHATNIAELSYFAETGRQMPERTKGDNIAGPSWADKQDLLIGSADWLNGASQR